MNEFPKETVKEIKAMRSLAKHLGDDYKECIDDALFEAGNYELIKLGHREARYDLLEKAYQVCLHCSKNEKAKKYLDKKADELGIKQTAASHLAIVVVKVLFDFSDKNKSLYQYAKVLQCACREKILPDALAKVLATKGNGIVQMANRFAKEVPIKPRAAAVKGPKHAVKSKPQPLDGGDEEDASDDANSEDSENDIDAADDDMSESTRSEESDDPGPTFSWSTKALKTWQSADAGMRIRLIVEKHGIDDGLVVKASGLKVRALER
jgi:hypothetical protein